MSAIGGIMRYHDSFMEIFPCMFRIAPRSICHGNWIDPEVTNNSILPETPELASWNPLRAPPLKDRNVALLIVSVDRASVVDVGISCFWGSPNGQGGGREVVISVLEQQSRIP